MIHPRGNPRHLLGIRGVAPTASKGRGLPLIFGAAPTGGSGILALFRPRGAGGFQTGFVESTQVYEQGFRIADDSLDVYELYVGEDGPPDFTASGQPVTTSPTLPFSWTPPGGTVALHIVVRKRNKYGLGSFNVFEKVIEFVGGVEQPSAVSAPRNVVVYDAATGYIRVVAKYLKSDDPSPATHWDVYVKIGSSPVIGVDPVTYTAAMSFFGAESGLATTIGPYTPGQVAHVLVSARRASDSERGNAAVVQKTLAAALDITEGTIFGGNVYEQR